MKKSFKWICLLTFLLICPEVFAALFDVGPSDKSKEYLGTIFGGSIGLIQLGGAANPMLSKMFEQFNFIIVTIGAIVISYIGVLSVVNTAREGEALGKKFSAWVVMRAFVGMLMMVPTPGTGYSIIQVLVMWIVLNGIGAANLIWGVVIDQLASGIQAVGSSAATTGANLNFAGGDSTLHSFADNVLKSATCMQTINSQSGGTLNTNIYGPVKIIRQDFIPDPPTINGMPNPPVKSGIPTGQRPNPPDTANGRTEITIGIEKGVNNVIPVCGSYTIKTSYETDSRWTASAADTQARLDILSSALTSMFSTFGPAAELLAQNQQPTAGYLAMGMDAYKAQVSQLSTRTKNVNDQGDQYRAAKQIGWIHAGNFYFALSQSSDVAPDNDASKLPTPNNIPRGDRGWSATISPNGPNTFSSYLLTELQGKEPVITRVNNALNKESDYAMNESDQVPNVSIPNLVNNNSGTGNGIIDKLISVVLDRITGFFIGVMQSQMDSDSDPILGLAQFGWQLMMAAEVAGVSLMIVSFGLSFLSAPMMCVSPAAPPVNLLLIELFLVLVGMCIMLWTAGAALNIYLPMVPYLVFTSSAFGWMMAVTEAIVGAPIIALGLVQPSGEEMGKIQAGLGILANVFLRPMLMIFGFILAAGLVRAGVKLVNYGFLSAVTGKPPMSTLFSFLAVLLMYMMFMIGIFNKSFSLIYELPNKVLRYMGVGEERHEPSELVREAKSGYDKGAEAGAKGVGKGLEATTKKIEKDRKAQEK